MTFTVTRQGCRMQSVGILSLLVLALLPTFGYAAILNRARRNDSRKRDISKEEIRASLNDFSVFFMGEIKQASSQLDELIPTTKTRKVTLMCRLRASQVLFAGFGGGTHQHVAWDVVREMSREEKGNL